MIFSRHREDLRNDFLRIVGSRIIDRYFLIFNYKTHFFAANIVDIYIEIFLNY